jgi:hypothetical protein
VPLTILFQPKIQRIFKIYKGKKLPTRFLTIFEPKSDDISVIAEVQTVVNRSLDTKISHIYYTRISGRYAALILGPAGSWLTLLIFVPALPIFYFPMYEHNHH